MRLLGGLLLWVTTLYCAPAARSKNAKGRGQEGGGVYPEFGVLGIQEGSSPALVREVGRTEHRGYGTVGIGSLSAWA